MTSLHLQISLETQESHVQLHLAKVSTTNAVSQLVNEVKHCYGDHYVDCMEA